MTKIIIDNMKFPFEKKNINVNDSCMALYIAQYVRLHVLEMFGVECTTDIELPEEDG